MIVNKVKHITIVAFCILITVPGLLFFINYDSEIKINKPVELLKDLKSSFPENYGFKNELLKTYTATKTSILDDKMLPNRVIKGNNHWWFLGNHYNNSLNNVFGNSKFSDYELNLVAYNLSKWQSYFQEKGIHFYVIIPPNKNKIYSEHLPFSLKQNETRIQQLQKYLHKKSAINFLDLTETVYKAKTNEDVFIKNDTHWNSIGAYYGYHSTMNLIKKQYPNIKVENIENYTKNVIPKYEGDIPRMVMQKDFSVNTKLVNQNKSYKTERNEAKIKVYTNLNKNLKALVYHDSFMLAMMPFFNETFKKTTFIKSFKISKAEINNHQPDIVILEIVERNLNNLLKLKKPLN